MDNESNLERADRLLKDRTILFSMWGCENEKNWSYQLYPSLKKIFKEVILFDPRKKRLEYGSENMVKKLLSIVKIKKPDYFLFLLESNNINMKTLENINKLSPNTKTIVHFGDDDIHFIDRSRYYALFIDHCLIAQTDYVKEYEKDGIKNTMPIEALVDIEEFKPLGVKRIYDLSFIGQPYPPRVEILRFLIKNGIKVNLWGRGWHDYEEFKEIYKGPVELDEYVRIINQSKINLSFSKNQYGVPHLKGRVFEIAACKSFQLIDYYPEYLKFFRENKEIVMYKDQKDLLNKINYYLKNEKEMEEISERSYKNYVGNGGIENILRKVFNKILEDKEVRRKSLPIINKKFIEISKIDIGMGYNKIKKTLENYDYVSFLYGNRRNHKYKNYLQMYSLEKTGKDISCCNYFIYSKIFGNYATFGSLNSLKKLKKDYFNMLINLDQIMVSKDYLLKNLDKFKNAFENKAIDFIDLENTAFISIPLVQLLGLNWTNKKKINKLDYDSLIKAFQINFKFRLQELMYRRRILIIPYTFNLVAKSITEGNLFILKYLFNSLISKENWNRIKDS